MDNNVAKKIKKLLSLANSENEHEAKLASAKAQKMMAEYNVSLIEVNKESLEFIERHTDSYKIKMNPADLYVWGLLQKHFFVKVINNRIEKDFSVLGTPMNVEAALYIRDFLCESYKKLYTIENKKNGWKGKNRKIFYSGLTRGIHEQLELKKQASHEKALLVLDKELVKFMNKTSGKLRSKYHAPAKGSREAFENGINHGRKLQIARGIRSESKNSNKFLK